VGDKWRWFLRAGKQLLLLQLNMPILIIHMEWDNQ
jgi:hypothetical protein